MSELAERLDAWLPQIQCARCGYPHCRAYAEALARGEADINRCPPGGEVTIQALADILALRPKPLDPSCGPRAPRQRARIDETHCIGCAKCLEACPVDAIVGSRRLMHTVLASECTGCGRCAPPCPVDCIAFEPVAAAPGTAGCDSPWPEFTLEETQRWRQRAQRHFARVGASCAAERHRRQEAQRAAIRAEIRAAVERVRARRRQLMDTEKTAARRNPVDLEPSC